MFKIQRVYNNNQMRKVLSQFKTRLLHIDEWMQWKESGNSADITCVVYNNCYPVALFTLDTKSGYLHLIDVGENYQGKMIGKAILYLIFYDFPQIQSISGMAAPEAVLFWLRIGAVLGNGTNSLNEVYDMFLNSIHNINFIPFTLNKQVFNNHLIATNFLTAWRSVYGFDISLTTWEI